MNLDDLERLLDEVPIEHEQRDDSVLCRIRTDRGRFALILRPVEAGDGLTLLRMVLPRIGEIEESSRDAAAVGVNQINSKLILGKLLLDTGDGELSYSLTAPVTKGTSAASLRRVIGACLASARAMGTDLARLPGLKSAIGATGGDQPEAPLDVPKELRSEVAEVSGFAEATSPEDMNRGIELCRKLIPRVDRGSYGQLWGILSGTLARLLYGRYERVNEEVDFRSAIDAFREALSELTRDRHQNQWAAAINSLGNLLVVRYERANAEADFQAARQAYEDALTVRIRERSPVDWAMTRNNLGNLLRTRHRHTGAEADFQAARQAYEDALAVYDRDRYPAYWAGTRDNLGLLLRTRYERTDDDFETARQAHRDALTVFDKERYPADWAATQNNLGLLLDTRYQRTNAEADFQAARQAYEDALTVYDKERHPAAWAASRENLANLLASRFRRTGADEDFDAARDAYMDALTVRTRQTSPFQWGETSLNLASLFEAHHSRKSDDESLEHAIAIYREILREDEKAPVPPSPRIQAGQRLARIESRRQNRKGAEESYHAAIEASEERFLAAPSPEMRAGFAGEDSGLYAEYASFLASKDNEVDLALRMMDRGRARTMSYRLLGGTDQLAATRLTQEDILGTDLPPGTVVVGILPGEHGTIGRAVIWEGRRAIRAMELPEVGRDWLGDLLHRLPKQHARWYQAHQHKGSEPDRWASALQELAGRQEVQEPTGWQFAVWLLERVYAARDGGRLGEGAYYGALVLFDRTVRRVLGELSARLWEPLALKLPADRPKIALLLPGALATLPVTAAISPHLSSLSVTIVPSLKLWLSARARPSAVSGRFFLAQPPEKNLPFQLVERERVLQHASSAGLEPDLAIDEKATSADAVLKKVRGAKVFHFGGHGEYNWLRPWDSAFLCSRGTRLTAAILGESQAFSECDLVGGGSCSSGIIDPVHGGDEFVGLPGALLQAGARAAVVSLWMVSDAASAFFFDEFYRLHLAKRLPAATAARKAAQWLAQATREDLKSRVITVSEPHSRERLEGIFRTQVEIAHPPAVAEQKLHPELTASRLLEGKDAARLVREDLATLPERPFSSTYFWAAFTAYGHALE